jgi:hypothetical protein
VGTRAQLLLCQLQPHALIERVQNAERARRPRAPKHDSTDKHGTMATEVFICRIVSFSTAGLHVLFESSLSPPSGVTPLLILVDNSYSVHAHQDTIRQTLAAFVAKSNASGSYRGPGPPPAGGTNIVHTIRTVDTDTECDIVLMTDGCENQHKGKDTVIDYDGNVTECDFGAMEAGSEQYVDRIADLITTERPSTQFFYLGIGADSDQMATSFVKRRNTTAVASIPCSTDAKTVVAVVDRLIEAGAASKRTPGETSPQEKHIFTTDPVVQAAVAGMSEARVASVASAASTLASTVTVMTADDVKAAVDGAIVEIEKDFPTVSTAEAKAVLVLAVQQFARGAAPAALFTGRYSSVLQMCSATRSFLNKLFSQLSRRGVLTSEGRVSAGGAEALFEGHSVNVSAGAAQYSCSLSARVVEELLEDDSWHKPVSQLVRADRRASKKRGRL